MTQTFAIAKAVESLSQVRERFGLVASWDEEFFTEWHQDLPALTDAEKSTLDHLKQRFLAHRDRSELAEGTVERLLV